jgi:hypothetical protein
VADYTVRADLPATFIAIDQPTADRLEALMERAAKLRIDSVESHVQASALCSELHAAWKELEATRVRLKAPALAVCGQIDDIARPFLTGLHEQREAIKQRVALYEAAENARIAEENRKAREAALERERELAALAAADACPLDEPMLAPVVRVEPPPDKPLLSSSVAARLGPPRLVIDDASKIPRSVRVGDADVDLLVPDEKRIASLLKANVPVPGCRLVRETVASMKPTRGGA